MSGELPVLDPKVSIASIGKEEAEDDVKALIAPREKGRRVEDEGEEDEEDGLDPLSDPEEKRVLFAALDAFR